MKKLQILRVDNDLVEKANLEIGDNIIGRSSAAERRNGQIDKHAATINVSPNNEMTITPIASCYMKSSETSRWQLLKLGATVSIKPGDICSLVSDKCWFKIVPVPSTMEINKEHSMKRKAEGDINCEIPDKMLCSESGEGDNARSFNNIANGTVPDNNNTIATKNEESSIIKEDLSNGVAVSESTDQSVENTLAPSSSNNNDEIQASNSKEQNNTDIVEQANKQNVPATLKARREKCKYGEKCYRRNARHKAEYSHPADPDYNIPDNKKECPYGTKCYRINPQHREEYEHTSKPTNAANNSSTRSRRNASQSLVDTLSNVEDFSADDSAEESVDESEYEPISEAEYSDDNEHFYKSESDWEDDMSDY